MGSCGHGSRPGSLRLLLVLALLCACPAFASTDDDAVDDKACADIGSANQWNMTKCAFARHYCDDNPYATSYYCSSAAGQVFLIFLYLTWLSLLFVMLGSTADDFFSPALEQFSNKLGLPPRFAGVTLLALGNGAPDVSSTVAAIDSGKEGYLLSLGALTGAGMFVGTVVAGSVMVVADGVRARGALIRDVTMFLVTCSLVMNMFQKGKVTMQDVNLLLGLYFSFILMVLAADIYHRTVTLPRQRAKEASATDGEQSGNTVSGAVAMLDLLRTTFDKDDNGSVELEAISARSGGGQEATGLSSKPSSVVDVHKATAHLHHMNRRAQYVIMHGDPDEDDSDYVSLNAGSPLPSDEGYGALEDEPIQELSFTERLRADAEALREEWEEGTILERMVLVAEAPFVLLRKATVPITAEDNYSRPWLIISTFFAPLWLFGAYAEYWTTTVGGCPVLLLSQLLSLPITALCWKLCRDSEPPPLWLATPLALVGFAVAATWIDTIADQLVSVLMFFGGLLHIPSDVLGMTVLAWGNSIGDFSTNMSMARKGLANMAITACFAGPVFNMLVGIGTGFAILLRSDDPDVTKNHTYPVHLPQGLLVGLSFLITNCFCIICFGLFNKNFVPKQYGFFAVVLYVAYLITSFVLLLS